MTHKQKSYSHKPGNGDVQLYKACSHGILIYWEKYSSSGITKLQKLDNELQIIYFTLFINYIGYFKASRKIII